MVFIESKQRKPRALGGEERLVLVLVADRTGIASCSVLSPAGSGREGVAALILRVFF